MLVHQKLNKTVLRLFLLLEFLSCSVMAMAGEPHKTSSHHSVNRVTVGQGCHQSDPEKSRCYHVGGPPDYSSADTSEQETNVVSVAGPRRTAERFRMLGIPMIAVNASVDMYYRDLSPEKLKRRNLELGMKLGRLADQIVTDGGVLCFLTPQHDLVAEKRIQGLRMVLSRDEQYPVGKPLSGESGWTECDGSPWQLPSLHDRASNEDILNHLDKEQPDLFISVSYWEPAALIEKMDRDHYWGKSIHPDISVIVSPEGQWMTDLGVISGMHWLRDSHDTGDDDKARVYIYLPHIVHE